MIRIFTRSLFKMTVGHFSNGRVKRFLKKETKKEILITDHKYSTLVGDTGFEPVTPCL